MLRFPHTSARQLALATALLTASAQADIGECPQPRFTDRAPDAYLTKVNPVAPGTDLSAARARYLGEGGVSCATCHGEKGDGNGVLASQFDPPPRNFRCAKTINDVPDGQVFWVIRYGSGDTAMPAHSKLSERETWELVAYLRQLAR